MWALPGKRFRLDLHNPSLPLTTQSFQRSATEYLKPAAAGWKVAALCILALLLVNTVFTYVRFAYPYQNWHRVYQKLPLLTKNQRPRKSVVFITGSRDAPIGDYPFKPLESAEVVYFKLGPLPEWDLTNSDWHEVYERYFIGRDAYIFEANQLKLLQNRTK